MGILRSILTAPVVVPIEGVLWLAHTIEDQANAELYDEDKIRGELTEMELALDMKQIELAEYEEREELLLARLREARELHNA